MIGLIFGETNFPIEILKNVQKKDLNYLRGLNIIGLKRKKYENKKIMELGAAFKKIFSSKNLYENLSKINGEYKANDLVKEVINFIEQDKKRPICTPNSKK